MPASTKGDPFSAELIRNGVKSLATGVVERQVLEQPDALERYGSMGFTDLHGDTEIRLLSLAAAVEIGHVELFAHETAWLKVAATARSVPPELIATNFACIAAELRASLPDRAAADALAFLDEARARFDSAPPTLPSLLEGDGPLIDLARRYLLAALEARTDDAVRMVVEALESGAASASEIYAHVIQRTQAEIGRMWQMNEAYVAEEHLASQVAARAMATLHERSPRAPSRGTRALCTSVGSDLHDLGIRAVAHHLEWAGWTTVQLGASMPAIDLVLAIGDFEIDLVAISANVPLAVPRVSEVISAIRRGERQVPIAVGGGPFALVPDLWRTVGADGTAASGPEAVRLANRLVGNPE